MLNILENRKAKQDDGPLFTAALSPATRRAKDYVSDRIAKSASGGIITEVVRLTPEIAEELLKLNADNRTLNATTMNRYATDMREGRWDLNGEAIKVSCDGALNDGQHRCHAVIEAGVPIQTFIVFGLPRSTRLTLDQPRPRSSGDFLKMEFGDTDPNNTAAAAALLWAYLNDRPFSGVGRNGATKAQIREVRKDNPGLVNSSHCVSTVSSKRNLSRSELIFFHYVITQIVDEETATQFVYLVRTGDELSTTDPIYRYRETLLGSKLKRGQRIELLFRTWNAWRTKTQNRRGAGRGHVRLMGELPDLEV